MVHVVAQRLWEGVNGGQEFSEFKCRAFGSLLAPSSMRPNAEVRRTF
jgi:hypothetical protein